MPRTQTENIPKTALKFREEDVPVEILTSQEGEKTTKRKFSMIAHSGKIMLNHWLWGNLRIRLGGMVRVVQTDANDLLGSGNRRSQHRVAHR